MSKHKEYWILKTPGGEFVEHEEPMNYDWQRCKKIHVIEHTAYAEAIELLRECRRYMEQDDCHDGTFVDAVAKIDKFLGKEK
jgi:ribulose bisphosphate carboxylase small subunit